MRIGLDFDGTIADVTWAKVHYAREAFGIDLTPEQTARTGGLPVLGLERYEELIRAAHGSELSLQMPPMPGALEAIERLLAADHELYIVTARLDDEADLAHRWLERHGLTLHGFVHTARASKAGPCRDLGVSVLLDDSPWVFADLDAATVSTLIDAPYNRAQPRADHVRVVEHWRAFEALVAELCVAV